MTPEERAAAWEAWLAERPERVRDVARRFEPWRLYHMPTTDHFVQVVSFDEPADGGPVTLKVSVTQANNPHALVAFDRVVFGVPPEDLEVPS